MEALQHKLPTSPPTGGRRAAWALWFSPFHEIWINYNNLNATSREKMVSKGNHTQVALIQVSEILYLSWKPQINEHVISDYFT